MLNQNLPVISALWIGGQLGQISRACLTSFLMRGHQVNLYTYDNLPDIPEGVNVCDANEIIHHSKIFKHKQTGSYAVFSDVFRYRMLQHIDGLYVDCDAYCIKPVTLPEYGYLMGFEDDNNIANGTLALPKNSQLLQRLVEMTEDEYFIPEWYANKKKRRLKWKKLFGLAKHLADMPWGVTGPAALTYYAKQYQVEHLAQAPDIFYPVPYQRISQLLDPNLTLDDVVTKNTLCVHLYNECLRHKDLTQLDPNCILAKMFRNEL